MTNLATLPPQTQTSFESLAALFKASGDPLRLEILRVLRRNTFGVMELSQLFDMRQSGMSHHLKVLAKAGLVVSQREGNAIFYRRPLDAGAHSADAWAARQVFAAVDRLPLSEERRAKVDAIRSQRSAQSRAFFARYAEHFREQQELIAEYDLYAEPVTNLIDSRRDDLNHTAALEIGPGEGDFLATLARRFNRVVAVDNSAEMLSQCEQTVSEAALGNVELVCGEAGDLANRAERFDLIVANMVLHHVPNPADVFADVAELLAPSGRLIVSELSRHDQNWVRENCGDIWLGFDPEELTVWAEEVGLAAEEPLFIGLRNGFQVQVREFIKPSDVRHQTSDAK
ncbi:metalloregulator ArsR/SmtB family transcription factor [Marinobacteraceae bacterium S3BR75-40.1]